MRTSHDGWVTKKLKPSQKGYINEYSGNTRKRITACETYMKIMSKAKIIIKNNPNVNTWNKTDCKAVKKNFKRR